ncbi:Acetyltransferase (GNAT) family protein [Sphingomonas gellani]|uniref:Acetyltransferase (GNAT) family protein n=1 Tax=Sphingomonas gellani TaxID=1166340 RepID=A0A1H8C5M4_9SPHN|nr:GNAT family N-acetyltransferase [Sphingomonas gellani]SEM90383.1 Acetyltransferase (GNAT) family protein [Sphingomonas gellani]
MTHSTDPMAWRAECACAAAWPSMRCHRVGDWLVHHSDEPSRRINAASPARPDARLDRATIEQVRAVYAGIGQPTLFRVPSFLHQADQALDGAGFGAAEGETRTLFAPLEAASSPPRPDITLHSAPSREWLMLRHRTTPRDEPQRAAEAARLSALAHPAAFATLTLGGEAVSIGYAAQREGWIVLEAIATDPAYRGRGHARGLVGALLAWGRQVGAAGACLQVLCDNKAAARLYAQMGFDRELYRYHYRSELVR